MVVDGLKGVTITDMSEENDAKAQASDLEVPPATAAHHVRLPRFILEEPVGLGQVVKRATSAVGLKPCGPCAQRAARLDQWLRIEPRR